MNKEKKVICVLCGREWLPRIKNLCECGGFCTWGYEPNKPESFIVDENGIWYLKPVPDNIKNI